MYPSDGYSIVSVLGNTGWPVFHGPCPIRKSRLYCLIICYLPLNTDTCMVALLCFFLNAPRRTKVKQQNEVSDPECYSLILDYRWCSLVLWWSKDLQNKLSHSKLLNVCLAAIPNIRSKHLCVNYGPIWALFLNRELRFADHYLRPLPELYISM